jgi:hypothetical protein
MLIETLLQSVEPPHEITHIFMRKNVTFFKLHNESFCTAAGKIAHSSSPVYDSGFLHTIADEAHDEETRELREAAQRDFDAEDLLWQKHQGTTISQLFAMALQIRISHGEQAMLDFVERNFDIYPTGAMEFIKKLEKS